MFIKNCPTCGKEMVYKKIGGLNNSIRFNSNCKPCFYKKRSNIDYIRKISESKMGDKNPAKKQWVRDKIRNSILKLYKEKPEIKDKISKSVTKFFNESPLYANPEELSDYLIYRKEVDNLSRRNKKQLFEKWNGYDYYDNEFIKTYITLSYNDKRYPTVDHKISILEGYKKKYSAVYISNIDNLCITKRVLNTSKGFKNEFEFFEKLKGDKNLPFD